MALPHRGCLVFPSRDLRPRRHTLRPSLPSPDRAHHILASAHGARQAGGRTQRDRAGGEPFTTCAHIGLLDGFETSPGSGTSVAELCTQIPTRNLSCYAAWRLLTELVAALLPGGAQHCVLGERCRSRTWRQRSSMCSRFARSLHSGTPPCVSTTLEPCSCRSRRAAPRPICTPPSRDSIRRRSRWRPSSSAVSRWRLYSGHTWPIWVSPVAATPPTRTPPAASEPARQPSTPRVPDRELIAEVQRQGHKISPDRVVRIARARDRRVVWLEEGDERRGQGHILSAEKIAAFEGASIPKDRIVDLIFDGLTRGTRVGFSARDRPVYEVEVEGRLCRVAITTGPNGYIVGAHPVSGRTKLRSSHERR